MFPALTLVGLFACGSNLAAQATSWTNGGSGSDWGTPGNWSAGVPVDPMTAAITFGDSAPNAAQIINLGSNRTITSGGSILLSSTGDRSYTLTGGKLTLNRDGANITFINNSAGTTDFTIDSDIDFTYTSGTSTTSFAISGAASRTVNLNGILAAAGSERILVNSANIRLNLRGDNSMSAFRLDAGEVVVYHANATGGGQLQGGGANAMFSLASNLTLGETTTTSTFFISNMNIRIREEAPASADRVITFASRVGNQNVNGQISIVDNINSTGRVILNMATTTNATVQHVPIDLGTSGLLRFSQSGATIYGGATNGSGIISGSGDVEFTGGGSTTFTAANTYTGTTTLTNNNSTLLLSGGGTIEGTSELKLGTGTTFNISGITPAGYTLGTDQTLSGTGTLAAGNKNLTLQGGLSPGNSPGTLTFNMGATGTLFLDSSVDITFDLGASKDLILLSSGTLNIGAGNLQFSNFNFVLGSGVMEQDYVLFQTPNTILGSLGAVTTGSLGGSYMGELKIDGNNLILSVAAVIPEPATSSLILLGAGAFLILRRLRKQA